MKNKRAYIWGFAEKFIPQGIYLLTNIILARFLTPQEFGTVGVLAIFIAIATTLSDSGLGGSLIKEQTLSKEDYSTVFSFNLWISSFLYFVIFISAGYIESFYHIDGLANITRCLTLILILNAFCIVPKSILIKQLQFQRLALISIVSIIFASVSAFVCCALNCGAYSLVAFQLGNALMSLILLSIQSHTHISFNFSKHSFKRLFSFGAFTTICGIIDAIYENILSLLIGKFLNVKSVGFYDQAKKLENGSAYAMVNTINAVAFPILTKSANDILQFKREAQSILKTCITIFFPLLATVALFSDIIIRLLFGEDWMGAAPYLSFLMVNGMIYIIESSLRNNIKSLGAVRNLALVTLLKRVIGITIICLSILISSTAMLYGLIISTFIGCLINAILYCKLIMHGLGEFLLSIFKMLLIPCSIIVLCIIVYFSGIFPMSISMTISGILLLIYYLIQLPSVKRFSLR